ADRALAAAAAGKGRGADDLARGDAHRVEQAVHEVDVVHHARKVGVRDALHLERREFAADELADLLGAPSLALLDELLRDVLAADIIAVGDEWPEVGIVNLDRDQAQPLALPVDHLAKEPPGRVVALHVADLEYAPGLVARRGNAIGVLQ